MLDFLKQIDRQVQELERWLPDVPADVGTFTFDDWLNVITPAWSWKWRHLVYVREHLTRLTNGEIDRLMIFLPPRHGKSEMVTIRYPIWRMERDPSLRVIVGAYNQTLANKFSRKARKIARGRIELNSERYAVDDWETEGGGGLRAVGVGGGITGMGGDLIVIDDPVRSRADAESLAYRDRVWDWYTDDLFTRREPGCSMVLIMTRWHEDDLAGRILNSEDADKWAQIKLPALALENDPLGRAPGEALCPERFDEEALDEIKTAMGRSFWALYQQDPQPLEGDFFKRTWFKTINQDRVPRRFERILRYWDKAATADGGDYTAGVLMGFVEGMYYVLDVVRGQWSTYEREKKIKDTAEIDLEKWANRTVWIEQEPGSGGKDSAQATIRNLAGFTARAERPTGKKEVRAEPFAAQAEAGNVYLLRAPWNYGYLDELCAFPNAAHDDQVDASSGAFNKLARPVSRRATSHRGY